jgi:hypothetical protein
VEIRPRRGCGQFLERNQDRERRIPIECNLGQEGIENPYVNSCTISVHMVNEGKDTLFQVFPKKSLFME